MAAASQAFGLARAVPGINECIKELVVIKKITLLKN